MTTFAFALVMQATLLATPDNAYSTALKKAEESGQALVVLVGADWCPGCRTMKTSVIPQLEKQGVLKKVVYTSLNTDRDREASGKVMKGGSIPQLIMFTKAADGKWKRRQLTGAVSASETTTFINSGAAQQAAANKAIEQKAAEEKAAEPKVAEEKDAEPAPITKLSSTSSAK